MLIKFITKSLLNHHDSDYPAIAVNIIKLLTDISANNKDVKIDLLKNIAKIPKDLWNHQPYYFYLLLQNIFDDYPITYDTDKDEEELVLNISQHIIDRLILAFKTFGAKMHVGELSVLKNIVDIQWRNKGQVLNKFLDLRGVSDLLDIAIEAIKYLSGIPKTKFETSLKILRVNMYFGIIFS